MKENTKMTETTATTAAETATEIQGTVNNIIDKFASRLTGATTPVSMDINIAVGIKGSIGDVKLAITSENYGTITNGAYRGEAVKAETAAKAEAEAEKREVAKREASRLLDLYTPEQLAEIVNRIK